jgi:hypothetical protein
MNWRKQSCRYADIPYPTTDVQVFQELSVTAPVVCHYRLHRLHSPARRRGIKCSFDYSRRYFSPGTRENETTSLKSCRYAITRSIDNGSCLPWFHSALSSVPMPCLIGALWTCAKPHILIRIEKEAITRGLLAKPWCVFLIFLSHCYLVLL